MQVLLLIAILVAALAVIFAVQNTEIVTVDFLFWSFQGSLALLLLVAFAAGAIASSLASIPSMFRTHRLSGAQRRKVEELEAELQRVRPDRARPAPPEPPAAGAAGDQNA